MQIEVTCTYCGLVWELDASKNSGVTACRKCGDRSPTYRDLSKDKIDYYAGSPPFPESWAGKGILVDPIEPSNDDDNLYPWSRYE